MNTAIPLADNLIALKGKTVSVSLSSGQTMTGVVREVQNNLLHLEKLSQAEMIWLTVAPADMRPKERHTQSFGKLGTHRME